MKWYKPRTWNTVVQKVVFGFLIVGGLASIVGMGRTALEKDYLSQFSSVC